MRGFWCIASLAWISNETPSQTHTRSYIVSGVVKYKITVVGDSVWNSAETSNSSKPTRKIVFLLNFKPNSLLKIGVGLGDDLETFPVSIMISVHWIQKGSNLMPSDTKIFLVPNSIFNLSRAIPCLTRVLGRTPTLKSPTEITW